MVSVWTSVDSDVSNVHFFVCRPIDVVQMGRTSPTTLSRAGKKDARGLQAMHHVQ